MKKSALEYMEKYGIVPVAVIEKTEDALSLAEILLEEGLPLLEVTFRTKNAAACIQSVHEHYPELMVGAGTVILPEQVSQALDAGAKFIVAPGLNDEIVKTAQERDVTVIPGVMTPSEIEKALSFGITHMKFFPAEATGGTKMLEALSAPYHMVRFLPTGGLNAANAVAYLSMDCVFAIGGSWIVPGKMIAEQRYDEIKSRIREAVSIAKTVRENR